MEKVCLVKRRQQYHDNDLIHLNCDSPLALGTTVFGNKTFLGQPVVEELNDQTGHFVCITMTEEQSIMLKNSEYIRKLIAGDVTDPALNLNLNACGQVVLRFSITDPCLRMIRSAQVCQMLQISRSFLQKLIHNHSIKSYKIGRLRRFIMEDILDYLIRHEEYELCNTVNDSGPILVRS